MNPLSNQPPGGSGAPKGQKSVMRSFRYAWEGVFFVFATQRHMRVHAVIIALVLTGAYLLGVSSDHLLTLFTAMCLVLITEMANTGIEWTIDLTVSGYDPRAKVAKDVAAGAVLIAAVYSLVVAAAIFGGNENLRAALANLPKGPPRPHIGVLQLVLIGSLLLALLVAWLKLRTRRGRLMRGGVVSGHTALGFLIATSIAIFTRDWAVTLLALALALLVLQSRLQARIHTPTEVLLGALLGGLVAWLLFLWPQ